MSEPNQKKPGSVTQHDPKSDIQRLPPDDVANVDRKQRPQSDSDDDHSDRPRRDHSEREGGGDQDIDTAGQVPGNKATDDKDPTGL